MLQQCKHALHGTREQVEAVTRIATVAIVQTDLGDRLASTIDDGISIQLGLPNISPQLLADRGQLGTVLVSLATNARDAMASDGPMGDAHDAANILTLSATVVDGSTVGPAGQGATASLFLPQVGTPAGQVTDGASPAGARKPRIILIDDDPEVLEILGEVLISCGYDVASFDDAAAALSHLLSEKSADLLITDLSMPGTDGLALIREAQRRYPGLPAILLTGYSGEELGLTTGRLAGGQLALLQKPVRAGELTKRVAAMLSDTLSSPS